MQLEQAIELGIELITTGEKHPDYARTVELAKKYSILSTGENVADLLRRYVKRESPEDFRIRVELTEVITGAVCGSLEAPWVKVTRNERIKKDLGIKKDSSREKVEKMIGAFYGSNRKTKTTKGLDYWLKTRFFELTFSDPNSWIAIEFKGVGPGEVILPHPFEIPAENALNFSIINDETQWLFCFQTIKMPTGLRVSGRKPPAPIAGRRFTLYDGDYTVVFEQVDFRWWKAAAPTLAANERFQKIGSQHFIIRIFEPKVGFAPVLRIGYKSDRATNGRTFVNPWHKALPFLLKSVKEVSEFDLTLTNHNFPQKLQYAYRCPGPAPKELCARGKLKDGSVCSACEGVGYKFHTSATDAIIVAMPDDGDFAKEDMIDLDKLIAYKSPPVDLIRWQNEHILQLKRECREAVFTVIQEQQSTGSGGSNAGGNADAGTGVTATEIDTNLQGIYDSLEPYTEKESEIWKEVVTIMGILAGEKLDEIDAMHVFPADFKLKTTDALLSDLARANESQAPSFLRDAITVDLAENVYIGDDLGFLKFKTKRKFFPFNGKTIDEIQFLVASTFVAKREKILYANFDAILSEIEMEHPEFYLLDSTDEQFEILEEKLNEWIAATLPDVPILGAPPLGQAEEGGLIADIGGGGNELSKSVGGLTGMIL